MEKKHKGAPDTDAADYEVGYGKPPLHGRFQPGQSGNPRGRPQGTVNHKTLLLRIFNECVVVKTPNGRTKRITKLEAALTQWANKAAKGDDRAIKRMLEVLPGIEADRAQTFVHASEARAQLLAALLRQHRAMKEPVEKAVPEE